ncbi:MAG: hypothetical protein ABI548_02475 [Polyangiaceae bacterium]
MIRRTAVCAALSLVFAALGCSGSNTSSGDAGGSSGAGNSSAGAFSTSVSGSEQLGSLSPADTQKLCGELQDYVSGAPFMAAESKFSCSLAGLVGTFTATDKTDAGIQAACKAGYDMCTATLTDTPPMAVDTTCNTPDPTCMATVAEYTACLNDAVKVFNTSAIPSCSSLTADNLQAALVSVAGISQAEPASCTTYDMKCPSSSMPNPGAM